MANNPYVNKVVFGSTTLIDITDTTAVASDVANGKYFYTANGARVQGTASGGGGSTDVEDGIITHTISGSYTNSRVTYVGSYAFYNCLSLTAVSFPACTSIGDSAFESCSSLTTVSFPECTTIGSNAFAYCSHLTTGTFSACTSIGTSAFTRCYSLTTVSFPSCTSIGISAFASCSSLTTVNFPECTTISGSAFRLCRRLLSAYFLGSSVPSLAASHAFSSTPIAGYTASTSGVYGSIYVRASMLSAFRSKTNWTYFSSRMVGLTDAQIAAL